MLMQNRTSANSKKSSCNARPDHTFGSFASHRHVRDDPGMSAMPPLATLTPKNLATESQLSAVVACKGRVGGDRFEVDRRPGELAKVGARASEPWDVGKGLLHRLGRVQELAVAAKTAGSPRS